MLRDTPLIAAAVGAVVVLVAFSVYYDSVDNEFVWDDPIVFDRQLPYFDGLKGVFFPPPGIPQFGEHYYRPLGVVTYLVDEWVAKTFWPEAEREEARRFVYHLSPPLYHAVATGLVFALGLALLRLYRPGDGANPAGAGAAALLFAVHPIHVESVAWMAGRSDVVCGVFFLLAALFYLRYRTGGGLVWLAASVVSFLGSTLTKETGLGFLLLAAAIHVLVPEGGTAPHAPGPAPASALSRAERRRRERSGARPARPSGLAARHLPGWAVAASFAAGTAIYFLLRNAGIQTLGSPALERMPSLDRFFGALGWYTVKLFWPPPQSAFVALVPGGPFTLLGIVLLAGILAALFVWGRRRAHVPELLAGLLFLSSLGLSLTIALFPISETPLAERYLYIPSAGVCLLLMFLLLRGHRLLLLLPVVVSIPLAMATVDRSEVWSNNLAFWTDAVEKEPGEGLPHLHLGITFTEQKRYEEAEREYRLALQTYRDAEGLSKAHNNLGSLLMRLQRYDEAIEQFQLALRQEENYETPHYNWALTLLNKAQPSRDLAAREQALRDAVLHFEQALRINPRYVKAHFQYGALLVRIGQRERGLPHLRRVVELAPASAEGREAQEMIQREAARGAAGVPGGETGGSRSARPAPASEAPKAAPPPPESAPGAPR